MLIDSSGRILNYLRISVTERCNLSCVYCMPPKRARRKPHETMLSFGEILRLSGIMADLGIRGIRVSGGEPLLRRGLASFLRNLKALPGIEKVTLTTNGLLLSTYLDQAQTLTPGFLPDGINISLDALNSERLKRITRRTDPLPAAGIRGEILPLVDHLLRKRVSVKLNCVPIRSFNEGEIVALAGLARDRNIAVRFIELMPIGCAISLHFIPGDETAALLEKAYGPLTPFDGTLGSGPAVYYSLPGFTGKIGFINAISRGFCETCNRLRLSSGGFLKLCLSDDFGLNLSELLRTGASDEELKQAIIDITAYKPRNHTLSDVYSARATLSEAPAATHPDGMYEIGG